MPLPSLRLRLLGWVLIPLTVVIAISSLQIYRNAYAAADLAYDQTLQASVRAIAEDVRSDNGEVIVDTPMAALEMFSSQFQDRVFYRVSIGHKQMLTGYADLPFPPAPPTEPDNIVYFDARYHGEPMRFAAFYKPMYDPSFSDPVIIEVGETLNSRQTLARQMQWGASQHEFVLLLAAAIAALIGLQRALKPLLRLRDQIQARSVSDLSPFRLRRMPSELAPLVSALNQYMQRLHDQVAVQKRFVADASHQLRTPLTLLSAQAEFALRQSDEHVMRQVIAGLHASTQQTIRLANQLLSLSRIDPESGGARQFSRLDLLPLACDVALELAPLAREKDIDLGFESALDAAEVLGDATFLHEMVVNLLDNAIRYTHAGGMVTVSVAYAPEHRVRLAVEDNGPGIPPEERERVFERFYRILGNEATGCGLGLAIVREICLSLGAEIRLATPASGPGLRVEIDFPPAAAEPQA
jgi:two-component system sensor histidine kinase TctE